MEDPKLEESRHITLLTQVCTVQSYSLPSSYIWTWELDHNESWVPKIWCVRIVVLEKTLESPLDIKEIKPVNPKGNQPWIFIGRTDAEAEALVLWLFGAKSWLVRKDPDSGKDWGQEAKGATEDDTVGWHHWLNGHEFEQTPVDGDGQGGLARCSPWCRKESDTNEQLNNKLTLYFVISIWENVYFKYRFFFLF